MPILKFFSTEGEVKLDNLHLEDITNDKRTSMINMESFLQDQYKIEENVYLALNDMFFKMAKIIDKKQINAMMIRKNEKYIIIVPSRSYVFWNGKSVDPVEYKIFQNEFDIMKLLKI